MEYPLTPEQASRPAINRAPYSKTKLRKITVRLSDEAYDQLVMFAKQSRYVTGNSIKARGLSAFIVAMFRLPGQEFVDDRAPELKSQADAILTATARDLEGLPPPPGMTHRQQLLIAKHTPTWLPNPRYDAVSPRKNRAFGAPLSDPANIKLIYQVGFRFGINTAGRSYSAMDQVVVVVGATLEAIGLGTLKATQMPASQLSPQVERRRTLYNDSAHQRTKWELQY